MQGWKLHDARILQAEGNIERLSTDMATVKCDIAKMKLSEVRAGKHPENRDNQIVESSTPQNINQAPLEVVIEEQGGSGVKDVSSFRKLDMPLFSSEEPLGWIFRVERYFKVNKVPDFDKLDATVLCFEGRALNWFNWKEVRSVVKDWPSLKRDLILLFHPSPYGNAYEMLMAL